MVHEELLDESDATRSEIEGHVKNITMANRLLGGTDAVMKPLTRLIGRKPAREPVRILDLGTGAADIPITIDQWARRHGIAVRILALDSDPTVVDIARRNTREFPDISIDLIDIRTLPYRNRSFEYVICSQVIHHLDTPDVIGVLRSMCRLATQGIVVSDLHRRPFCIGAAWVGSRLVSNRLSRKDAAYSFRSAFTPAELEELAVQANLPCWEIHKYGPCRLVLVMDMRSMECRRNPVPPCHAPATG